MHRSTFHYLAGALAVGLSVAATGAQLPTQGRATVMARMIAASGTGAPNTTAAAAAAAATGRTLLGATAGAVLGGLAGGIIGAAIGSRASACQVGDPDGCLGAQLPEALWGTGVGITVGTPIGAHLGNRRGGQIAYTMLASAALFAGEVVALRSLVHDGRTEHKNTVVAIAVVVPVLQILATTLVERAFAARAP